MKSAAVFTMLALALLSASAQTNDTVLADLKERLPRDGHFAAMETPDLLVPDVRKFFQLVRSRETR